MRLTAAESDLVFPDEPASSFIVRTCLSNSGEITLITLGALTNIAQVPSAAPGSAAARRARPHHALSTQG